MKAIVSFLMLSLLSTSLWSQSDFILRHLGDEMESPGFTSMHISQAMFSLFADLEEAEEEEDVQQALSRMQGLRILSHDELSPAQSEALGKKLVGKLRAEGFEALMDIREGQEQVRFYGKRTARKGRVSELVMLIFGGKEANFFILSISGDISLKEISKLTRNMEIEGLEKLENIEEH